jgi:deazaflavin-dependent oxidoreductase (nitroreductase family)
MRTRKYRVIIGLERMNNRMTRAMLRRGIAPPWFALLETTGRRTGKPRHTPIGAGMRAGERTFWLISAHGEQADYVRNIKTDPRVRIKLRGTWHQGTATLLPDDDTAARSKTLPYQWDALIGRLMATSPLTVRIDLD